MSYHIYSTQGIILRRTPIGEANIIVHILTRDLGLIIASAQSARLSTSKLSAVLTEYSSVTVSVIKGKRGWKITDARIVENFYFKNTRDAQGVLAQLSSFLIKMIPGEEPLSEIFDTMQSGFSILPTILETNIKQFESVAVLRVLYYLGYVVKNIDTKVFLSDTTAWTVDLYTEAEKSRLKLISVINHSLKESHL